MKTSLGALALLAGLSLGAAPEAAAQPEAARADAPAAPSWAVGDWWELAVDREEVRPTRFPRATPVPGPLPGLARRGPRPRYLEVARWRFEVSARGELPDADGRPLEAFYVEARRVDRAPRAASFRLVFVGPAKVLCDVEVRPPGRRARWLRLEGDAVVLPPGALAREGLDLVWPDLRAGPEAARPLGREGRALDQRRRQRGAGPSREQVYELRSRGGGVGPRCRIRWRSGEPWWFRARGPGYEVRLLRTGRASPEER